MTTNDGTAITQMGHVLAPFPSQTPTAERLLRGRTLTVVGDDAFDAASRIDISHGGLVLTRKDAVKQAEQLRRAYPQLLVAAEPTAHDVYVATSERPFLLPEDGLVAMTLQDFVDDQRANGATLVMLPSGHLEVGDTDSLRAMQRAADAIDGDDLVLHFALPPAWLNAPHLGTLIGVTNRSRHVVMFSFTSQSHPLSSKKLLKGHRELFASTQRAFAHRADFAGLDARAQGAIGTSIGMIPSLRRSNAPKKTGRAGNAADKSPHMLHDGMLRFVKSTTLRQDWYPSTDAPLCACCGNLALDRLTGSTRDRLEGHMHNVVGIQDIGRRSAEGDLVDWWARERENAISAHTALSARIGRELKPESDLVGWAALDRERSAV